jgi:hypothetical protein
MTSKDQFSVLLDLVVELRNHGSWAGETHVQKAAYLLQELLGLPTGFDFVLYKHGPFSFDLRDSLEQMEAGRLIELQEQPYPYGPKIAEGPTAPRFRGSMHSSQAFQQGIAFISRELGSAGVAELERIATALFVSLDREVTPADRPQKLVQLKPHVQLQDAKAAFVRLEEIRSAATLAGLDPNLLNQTEPRADVPYRYTSSM